MNKTMVADSSAHSSLPPGWRLAPLAELSLVPGRYGSPEPARPYDPYLPRYVRITDIDDQGTLRTSTKASISSSKAEPHLLQPGDLLIARSGSTVGKSYLYDPRDGVCAHAGYLIRFRLDPDRCDPQYVAHYTRSTAYWGWIRRTQRQAAQPNINADELRALTLPLPPLAEQRRIAAVLTSSVDAIRASARLLATHVAVKRALVAELMTRGVDRRGQLRSPGRDSSLGPLPDDWQVRPVSDLLARTPNAMRSGPFGSELKKSDLCARGIPLLGIDNVHVDRFTRPFRRFISVPTFHRLERYQVFPGDVMITVMGTVGRACVVPGDIDRALSSKHVWTLTFDKHRYLGSLAALQFNHAPWVRAHFRRDEQGGTMYAIRSETLRTVMLPVPPMREQRRIAAVLARSEKRVATERAALRRYKTLHRGLMNDLFSGRTQVP